jgi:hypothetical protein
MMHVPDKKSPLRGDDAARFGMRIEHRKTRS